MLLKTRIVLGVSLAMAVLSAGFWFTEYLVDRRDHGRFFQEKVAAKSLLLKRILLTQKHQMTAQTRSLMRNRDAHSAIASGIAEDIADEVLPTFIRLKASRIIDGLVVGDLKGSLLLKAPEDIDSSSAKTLLGLAVKNRMSAYGAVLDARGALSYTLAFPLFKSGILIGSAAYSRNFRTIAKAFKESDGDEILITDRQSRTLLSTNPEFFGSITPSQLISAAETGGVVKSMGSYFEAVALPVEDVTGRPIARFFIVSDVTPSFLEQRQASLLTKGALGGFVIVFLCGLAFWLRRQFRPLTQTVDVLQRLSKGDYDINCDVNERRDEIGALASTVSVFRENLVQMAKAEAVNQRLARIVEDSVNEIYVFDTESLKFLQVNMSACNNLGYTMEELRELTPYYIKPQFTREAFEKHIAPLRTGEKAFLQFETVHRRKDGTIYDVKITLQQIISQNQKVFTGIVEDITDRKRTEEELGQILRSVPRAIIATDKAGIMRSFNPAAEQTFGYAASEAIGRNVSLLMPESQKKQHGNYMLSYLETGVSKFIASGPRRLAGRHKDGSEFPMELTLAEFGHGETVGFIGIARDITEELKMETQLIENRDMLQKEVDQATVQLKAKADQLALALEKEKKLNELQRDFISMASHEFRTPLAIIDGTAQRMRSRAERNRLTPEDAVQRVEKIRGAVQRMTQLMESTLSSARMEEGKIALEIGPCNIGWIIREVCARQQTIAKDHFIRCDLAGLPETIQADSGSLEQIFTNLLSNAVKYAPDAPQIEIRALADNDHIVVSVRDYGLGIDEDDLPKMFERFFRAKTSAGISGTGIGLNLLKALVELHDGSVDVESRKGEGSIFTVRLPVAGPDRAKPVDTRAA